jgi:CubicO group peptidase (beta-lactamase class C family)
MDDPAIGRCQRIGQRAASVLLASATLFGGACARPVPPTTPGTTAPSSTAADREVAFPSTPAGNAAAEWLHAVNDASPEETPRFYRTRYAKALLDQGSAEDRRDNILQLRLTQGRRHVRAVERASETQVVVVLEVERTETWQRVTIEVDATPPHVIVRSEAEDIAPPGEPPPHDEHEAIAILDGYVKRMCDRELFSGVVAVARGGSVVYERACGLASRAFGVPNRVDTKFNLGSMNKMFTAVSIAQLVEAGKLSYGDTLAKVWPEYPNRAVAEKVTIHQLLTHTSGLGDYFTDEYDRMAKDRLRAIKDYLPLFVDKPLAFEPGTRFQYSNAGFMVLGGVVERVSGQDYFDYVRAHVYGPAGMKDSDAFEMDHDTPNLAIGYGPDRAGPPGKMMNNLFVNTVKGGPAGGGFSTAGDLIAFGDALLRGRLVSPAQVTVLTTSHGGPEPKYAYGFELGTFEGQRVVGHGGGFFGVGAGLYMYPDIGLSIVVLSNLDDAGGRVVDRAEWLLVRAGRRGHPDPRGRSR